MITKQCNERGKFAFSDQRHGLPWRHFARQRLWCHHANLLGIGRRTLDAQLSIEDLTESISCRRVSEHQGRWGRGHDHPLDCTPLESFFLRKLLKLSQSNSAQGFGAPGAFFKTG